MTVEWRPGEGWTPPLSDNDPTRGFRWTDALLLVVVALLIGIGLMWR